MNSINWYEKPSSTSGFESKDFWGKELNDSKGQEQLTINLPSISSGEEPLFIAHRFYYYFYIEWKFV